MFFKRTFLSSFLVLACVLPANAFAQGIEITGPSGERISVGGASSAVSVNKEGKSVNVGQSASGIQTQSTNSRGTTKTKQSTGSSEYRSNAPQPTSGSAAKVSGSASRKSSATQVISQGSSEQKSAVVESSSANSSSGKAAVSQSETVRIAGGVFKITGNSQVQTVSCKGRDITVNGLNNELTLKGDCPSVTVYGNSNVVRIEAVDSLSVNGIENDVSWVRGLNSEEPDVRSSGNANRVYQVG